MWKCHRQEIQGKLWKLLKLITSGADGNFCTHGQQHPCRTKGSLQGIKLKIDKKFLIRSLTCMYVIAVTLD